VTDVPLDFRCFQVPEDSFVVIDSLGCWPTTVICVLNWSGVHAAVRQNQATAKLISMILLTFA
jgi:hypothetical protein